MKVHPKGYLNSDNLLPPVVVNDHKLSREEWEEKIAKFHAKHNGMSRAEAMMEYLKVFVCSLAFCQFIYCVNLLLFKKEKVTTVKIIA